MVEVHAIKTFPVYQLLLSSRVFYQDSPHRFGSSAEEVPSTIPLVLLIYIGSHKSQTGFMH